MRIAVIGGGPGGLYFALLTKRDFPGSTVEVFERNRADDTFGFGVVFSDQTLDTFERHDRPSYEAIRDSFAYWDDIEIHFKGSVQRIGGNGFCGCARVVLLQLLQRRCCELGVDLHYEREVTEEQLGHYDLIVAADGINSRVREADRAHFVPEFDVRPNWFCWMGSARPLDAFKFFFRETEHGIFIAHAYQYEAGLSTWVMETDPATFARAGLEGASEAQSAAFLERVFAAELGGHRLVTNRSVWRRFPMIRCRRWVRGKTVLIGDAKGTAHFSIGSGTKLAMEDAIALHEALARDGDIVAALADFETARRLEVEKTQHAADVSLVWFEHVRRFWGMTPVQFGFGLMTRSRAITYDNLRLRAPAFVDRVDADAADRARSQGFDIAPKSPPPPMFLPFRLRDMVVQNRVAVAPMCQYSSRDGMPGDWHLVHLGSRAIGGAGLIFTEMTDVSPEARISPGCAGLWNDAQAAGWTRVVEFVHAQSDARICLQLGHAGRKGSTKLSWEGDSEPLPEGNWPLVAASPLPYHPYSQVPAELDRSGMDEVIDQFVAATRRGLACGFDMVELHCAHGYLLASFISPLTNQRTDAYGGSLANRLRFPLEVFDAIRATWPTEKPVSVRISASDWAPGGLSEEDATGAARLFREAGVDLVDVSTGQTVPWQKPRYGRMYQTPFSDRIRNELPCATMAVGNITTADQVNTIVAAGRADLVALARPHLSDPYFTLRAAAEYGHAPQRWPDQYVAGRDQLYRLAEQQRAQLREMRLASRPKQHLKLAAE